MNILEQCLCELCRIISLGFYLEMKWLVIYISVYCHIAFQSHLSLYLSAHNYLFNCWVSLQSHLVTVFNTVTGIFVIQKYTLVSVF